MVLFLIVYVKPVPDGFTMILLIRDTPVAVALVEVWLILFGRPVLPTVLLSTKTVVPPTKLIPKNSPYPVVAFAIISIPQMVFRLILIIPPAPVLIPINPPPDAV